MLARGIEIIQDVVPPNIYFHIFQSAFVPFHDFARHQFLLPNDYPHEFSIPPSVVAEVLFEWRKNVWEGEKQLIEYIVNFSRIAILKEVNPQQRCHVSMGKVYAFICASM